MLASDEFVFLNRTGQVRREDDWDSPSMPRLWNYNLHYFDDLNAAGSESRSAWHRSLLKRWIAENPPFRGTGWEPYPTSLRIVNWIKWAIAGNDLGNFEVRCLAIQADLLHGNLEWHLLGNHLFANAKALVFAGAFFEGGAAERWMTTGLRIIGGELHEQILPDGGQFERSPMYHALATEDVLDLVNLGQAFPSVVSATLVEDLRSTAGKMLRWLHFMCHPDGDIALFNDSAFGIAPSPDEIFAYAERLGVLRLPPEDSVIHLRDTGYVRASSSNAVLFADIGDIGPDYLPGHAHADTLCFELSLFGERWIVDTGCSTYETSDERLRQRGTYAHNTVCVDGADSSEVWSSFRVARRARCTDVSVHSGNGEIEIAATQTGYCRLPGRVRHRRTWKLHDTSVEIGDELLGDFQTAVASIILHPEVDVSTTDAACRLHRNGKAVTVTVHGGTIRVENTTWHPEFGVTQPTRSLRITLDDRSLQTIIDWSSTAEPHAQ